MQISNKNSKKEGKPLRLPLIGRSKSLVLEKSIKKARDKSFVELPEFSPIKNKHTVNHRKILMNNSIEIINNNKKYLHMKKSPRRQELETKRIQLIQYLKQKFIGIQTQILQLIREMRNQNVPDYYQFYELKKLQTEQDPKGIIQSMIKQFQNKQTFFHKIKKSFQARKAYVIKVQLFVTNLKKEQIQIKAGDFAKGIQSLRLLTAGLIQNIQKWRQYVGYSDERPVYFTSQKCLSNVLIELLNDTSFILHSEIANLVDMGTKNDPFLLSPIRKAEGKESSPYLHIFKLAKPYDYYQKYMEYLASQKAFELSRQSPKKNHQQISEIQRIYSNKHAIRFQKNRLQGHFSEPEMAEQQKQHYRQIQLQKQRSRRLRKNQQRINMIKNVYEKEHNLHHRSPRQKSHKQLDLSIQQQETKVKKDEIKKITKIKEDQEFEQLVRKKYKSQSKLKKEQKIVKKVQENKFDQKQQKMIDNVKDIQNKLKMKIREINMSDGQSHLSLSRSANYDPHHSIKSKPQKQLINEMKGQIITKIEHQLKQKQQQKIKQKIQEERMLEEIKTKMKKQVQERMDSKKREKMIEKQELQKKLKQEQQKLSKQKQMEARFQARLAKQKQLRQIEKFKRQALERQIVLKQQLQEQARLRRQNEQAIDKQRREKNQLLKKLQIKELAQNIQNQVKQHIYINKDHQLSKQQSTPELATDNKDKSIKNKTLKNNSESASFLKAESVLKRSSDSNVFGSIKEEQQSQKQKNPSQQIQNKNIKKQKQEELRKQIELIKAREQREIDTFKKQVALRQRILQVKLTQDELNQRQMENLVRAAILDERKGIKSEALDHIPDLRNKVQQKMKQEQDNEKAHQAEIDKINKERQMQEQQYRKKIRQKIQKQLRIEAIQKTKREIEAREKKQINQKQQLHANFMRKQRGLPKDKSKIQEKTEQQEQKQRQIQNMILAKQSKQQLAKSSLRERFQHELLQSYMPSIYKQPEKSNTYLLKNTQTYMQDDYLYNKLDYNRENNYKQFEHVPLNRSDVVQHMYELNQEQMHVYNKQKKRIAQKQQGEDLADSRSGLAKNIPKKTKIDGDGFELVDVQKQAQSESGDEKKYNVKVVKNKMKQKQKQIEQSQQQVQQNRLKQVKQEKLKHKLDKNKSKQYSRQQEQPDSEDEIKKQNKVIYYDAQLKQKQKKHRKKYNFPQVPQISVKKIKPKPQKSKYNLEIEALPEEQLDQYMENHFLRLPVQQTNILPLDREQLYRKLINQLTFCLILGQFENRLIGMAYVCHDRMRYQTRRLIISHISTYNSDHLKDFILQVCDYLFRKDPCDEIQFVYQYNQTQQGQKNFATEFNKWFDQYGHIYQKKLDDNVYERKYVYKRKFNQQCEIVLRGITKNSFSNIFNVYSGVLMSAAGLSHVKDQIKIQSRAEDWVGYGVMVSQLFRNFMNPDDAQILKNKVKQVQKLKQLLVMVVMLQKKKMKLDDLKLYSYKNLIELNMKLMSQGKEVVRYVKDTGVQFNEIFYCQLNFGLNLPFGFQTTSLPTETKQDQIRQISYFRLNPLNSYKLHLIKSSLYNAELHILPTENSKTKLFLVNASQYLQLRQKSKIDLFMYIRFFMKNVRSHTTAAWKYVWVPEMIDKGSWQIKEFQDFFKKDMYVHDTISLSYRQFLPNALIIEPEHRDLVITPPFIIGILSMGLQQITEGSPIYARLIDADSLKTIQIDHK